MKRPPSFKIAYIGGGSTGWAAQLMNDLALADGIGGTVALYDLDTDAARRNEQYGNWLQEGPGVASRFRYTTARALGDALKGADFVIASITPAPLSVMAHDLGLPEQYGILQSVGDTVGPGGILRALRAVPVYQDFAHAIARHCPGAWVINYTNPMTVLTRTLNKVQPRLKVFGCCHEVFGTQGWLAGLAASRFKVPAPSRQEIKIHVMGINHFTWFSKAVWKGHDLLALARREMSRQGVRRKYTEQEILRQLEKAGHAPWSVNNHEITYELFSRYGLLPAAGDRHLAEFVPGFLESRRTLYRWGIAPTGVAFRLNMVKERIRKMRDRMRDDNRALTPSGEEGVAIMKSLLGFSKLRTNVNFPNQGQIANLPRHAVVETLADFSGSGVKPVDAGALPAGVLGKVLPHVLNQELVVEAALRRDLGLAFQAFLNDPLMPLAPDKARELFDKMVKATRPWLRGYQ